MRDCATAFPRASLHVVGDASIFDLQLDFVQPPQKSFRLWPTLNSSAMSADGWRIWRALVRGLVWRQIRSRCWFTLFSASIMYAMGRGLRDNLFLDIVRGLLREHFFHKFNRMLRNVSEAGRPNQRVQ